MRSKSRRRTASPGDARAKELENKLIRRTAVLHRVSTGILLTNSRGTVTYLNPAFERIYGRRCREIVGRKIKDLARDRKENEILEPLMNALLRGEPWRGDLSQKNRGARKVWETRISPLRKSGGTISGYIVSMRDVTDERRIENRVRQVQKMEALGNLAGGIAHDLRNIFTPIIVNTELLLMESGKEPRERAFLEQVLRAAREGKDIVDQITIFSRGAEGERKTVALGALIEDSLKILRPTLPSNIELRTKISTGEDSISANPAQIHQILMNLYGNAVQAMEEKGGTLDIVLATHDGSAGPEVSAGTHLELRVGDTGCGMSSETMERAFEPFFTTKDGGSGMGLAIVHGIVKNLGGTITVDSEFGRGSVFHVFLPKATSKGQTFDRAQKSKVRKRGS
jgi:PAS domain S-box-containing protein